VRGPAPASTGREFGKDALLTAIAEAGIPGPCFAAGDVDAIPEAKGAYALLIRLDRAVEVLLPKPGFVRLPPGWFVYCGSAKGPGGLRARLRRHFRTDKTERWHVDRLTIRAAEMAAVPVCGGEECRLVSRLLRSPAFEVAVAGFGSSDCAVCESHLLQLLR
jgi:Uri superfamily endonuclease